MSDAIARLRASFSDDDSVSFAGANPIEDVKVLLAEHDRLRAQVENAAATMRRLVDWTYLYALEGQGGWPDSKTIADPLIRLATARAATQEDAEQFKLGSSLSRFSPSHSSTMLGSEETK